MKNIYTLGYALLICLSFLPLSLFAQPSNDDCSNAILIDDITQSCSSVGEYTNEDATPTNFSGGSCVSNDGKDVWFRFTAIATDLTLTVVGNTGGDSNGGTLNRPEAELYVDNNCGENNRSFESLQCEPGSSSDIVELYKGGLIPGQTYLIRVQGRGNREGTFQLCLENYFPPVEPGSDLEIASVLCDKSKFVIQQVVGTGNDNDEAEGTCLDVQSFFGPVTTSEQSSTWFTWIAANDGTLEFTIDPLKADDDIDFVVYELPNGLNNSEGKIALRCMATACEGPTGLSVNSTDDTEDSDCDPGEDGFVRALDMKEGVAYGVLINNFSESGNGFSMEFGGTGEFQGPEPQIDAIINSDNNVICAGEEITFTGENSRFVAGSITQYEWTFGVGAEATSVTGPGPHTVSYTEPGEKSVVLTITTDLGCKVSDIKSSIVVVEPCCEQLNGITGEGEIKDIVCGGTDGAIDLTLTSNSEIEFIEWSNSTNDEDLTNLAAGDYFVTVTNLATCRDSFPFTVDSIPPFEVTPTFINPTCGGGTDGAIDLNIENGAAPILVDFGNGASEITQFLGLSAGDYTVTITDADGCSDVSTIELTELNLLLDTTQLTIQTPSCNGFENGRIAIQIANGDPNYTYDWNDGNGPVPNSNLNNIPAGNYQVAVMDANLCEGNFNFVVAEPDALTLAIDTVNISCEGLTDGMVTAIVEGGTGDYSYEWNNTATTEQIMNLSAGNYAIEVTDENDCQISGAATIIEPNSINIEVTGTTNALCFGEETGSISVLGTGGNNDFQYSADGINFQNDPTLSGLVAGEYTLTIRDPRGCMATTTASIGEPDELSIDAGEDQSIDLGYSVDFQTIKAPFTRDVTYTWTLADFLSCPDCPNPTATPNNTMSFVVTITDETNCTASDTVMVFVNLNRPIYTPNVFSPNFDGLNDNFTVFGGPAAVSIKTLQIFDRWGNLVFNGADLPISNDQSGWDGLFNGQALPPGVYTYVANILFLDGVEEVIGGDVTLVR